MNLDDLISKYLDGDMSEEDDLLLRSKVAEDEPAHMKFDSAVNLHLAMKEDADSIIPPDDMVKNTEDLVMMKILSQPIVYQSRSFGTRISRQVYPLAAIIAFVFFAVVFNIYDSSDYKIKYFKLGEMISNSKQLIENTSDMFQRRSIGTRLKDVNIIRIKKEKFDNQNSQVIASADVIEAPMMNDENADIKMFPNRNLGTSPNYSNAGALEQEEANKTSNRVGTAQVPTIQNGRNNQQMLSKQPFVPQSFVTDIENKNNLNSTDKTDFNKPGTNASVVVKPASINYTYQSKEQLKSNTALDVLAEPTSSILVSSVLGTDIARGGISTSNKNQISHFAQSLGYSVNKDVRIGIEFGYTEYAYNEHVTLNKEITINPNAKLSKINQVNIPSGGDNPVFYVDYQASLARSKQMMWVSAFYEREILNISKIGINGRIGGGLSGDGPIGYGRLFATYDVMPNIAISLGTDGSVFTADLPKLSEAQNKLRSTISIVYGILFKL